MNQVLEADSIRCSFDGRQLLTDVYVKCERGKVVGLLGRNGSGKSTLLKIIFGSQWAENRNVRVDHKSFIQKVYRPPVIGYLPQGHFLPAYTVEKAIRRFLLNEEARDRVRANKIINRNLDKYCEELSGGQQRLLEFLLLFHSEMSFLLLDEPFSAVEPLIKDELKELIQQNKMNKGFIITDHDYRHVLDIADELLLLDNGVCRHLKSKKELEQYNYVPPDTFT